MITVITSLLGIGPQDPHFQLPPQASTFAEDHDNLYQFVEWVCYFFFFLITGILIYSVIRYRRRSEDQPPASTTTHHTALEVTWTVVPLIIVMIIFAWGWRGAADMLLARSDSLQFEVRAQRWQWSFKHPGDLEWFDRELWVPINKPVQLTMSSEDVLHSIFIPEFRVKRDVLPGRAQTVWFIPTMLGVFDIFCTEYCGLNHSQMLGKVRVVDQATFDARWWDSDDPSLPWEMGKKYYRNKCATCHSIDGTTITGPSFLDVWERTEERLGVGDTEEEQEQIAEYLRTSVRDPSAETVEGFEDASMTQFPPSQLSDERLEWIIEFLKNPRRDG